MPLIQKPFVFARHAQSTYNAAKLIGGLTDSPLTELGIQQAQNAASQLSSINWSAVYTSSLIRTQQTAHYAVPGQAIIPLEGLKERDWGSLDGCPMGQQTPYEMTPPNGEPWQVFEDRVLGAINQILSQHERPLIIAHSGVYRVLNKLINGTPYCPRIDNITPMSFTPNEGQGSWAVLPLAATLS